MEVGLREILIILGFLVIAGILVDGIRRTRQARMGSLDLPPSTDDDNWGQNSELPNGGARPVGRHEPAMSDDMAENEPRKPAFSEPAMPSARPVSAISSDVPPVRPAANEGSANLDEDMHFEDTESLEEFEQRYEQAQQTKRSVVEPPAFADPGMPKENAEIEGDADKQNELFSEDPLLQEVQAEQQRQLGANYEPENVYDPREEEIAEGDVAAAQAQADVPGEVIIINVIAKDEADLPAKDFYRSMASCGFHHGDMDIFHRFEQHNGGGRLLFSAANVVEPGTFPAEATEDFGTPGVCLFLQLPGPARPLQAYDAMVDASRKLSTLMHADIKDEQHSVMTQQTFEHCRQRVIDFERKLLSAKATVR